MNCPDCSSHRTTVRDTRDYADYRRRRRRCEECGCRFSTYEVRSEVFESARSVTVAIAELISKSSKPLLNLKGIAEGRGEYDKGERT